MADIPAALAEFRNARDCLVQAAAALTAPYDGDNLGAAVLWTATALMHIGKGDLMGDGRGETFALGYLARLRVRRG